MKKLFFTLALIVLTIAGFSQKYSFTATHFASKYNYQSQYGAWTTVNIPVTLDTDNNRIVVFSQDQQIIDYVNPEMKKQDGYDYMIAYATDSKYKSIVIEVWFMNNDAVVLRIKYSDFEYQYQLAKAISNFY